MVATACSSSSKSSTAVSSGGSTSGSASPGTKFSTADVSALGTVVVDGKGRTVYVLTDTGKSNVPCEDSTGCTKLWPDLPFPDGTSSATAGAGVQTSLLGSMKLSDGETYPTYNKWLMYEYAGDSGPAQGMARGSRASVGPGRPWTRRATL